MGRGHTMKKKKIALLIPNLANGGAEKMASNLSDILYPKYDVSFILFDGSKIDYPYSGNMINVGLPPLEGKMNKVITMLRRIHRVKQIKKKHQFDMTISFLENANVVNLFSKCGDKVVLTVHNYNSKRNYGFLYENVYRWLMKCFYNKADRIVAVSKMIARDMISNYRILEQKIEVIYNFIDMDNIKKLMQCQSDHIMERLSEKPVVINVGRLYSQKGHCHLIHAFKLVLQNVPDAQLVILGHGELEEELKTLVKNLGMENHVHFMGFRKNPYQWMAYSKVLVSSSLFEGFGNVLIEAMCCGLPVISTDCRSGPREILAPATPMEYETKSVEYAEYGILTPVCTGKHQEESLAQAMVEMLTNETLRQHYIAQSQKRVQDFSKEKATEQWYQLIDSMNQYQIFICGNFGYANNQLDGQTVKTRQLKDQFVRQFGEENIIYSDMSQWKKRPLSMYREIKRHAKNSKSTLVLLGPKGIRLLLPQLVRWKKKYSKDLRYIVIGGWLATVAQKNNILASALKKLDRIYVETSSMQEKLRQIGITNTSVLPNFRRFHYINHIDSHSIQLPIKAVILSRIIKEKGIHTAIDAVKSINQTHGKICITLDIYGQLNKKYAAEFQTLVRRSNGHATYKGYLEEENIQQTLMQYDLMIFPTYYHGEGFPGAIIDAYAAGLPVVASDWKYNREVVDDGKTGIFFEPQNTADLIQKLNSLISNPQSIEQMKYHCLEKAKEYHVDTVLAELIQELRRG